MTEAEFDRHAADYRQQHRDNIAVSGEAPEYFSDYKMRDFASLIVDTQLPLDGRYLDFGSGIGTSAVPFKKYMSLAHLTCADVSSESLRISEETNGEAVEHVWMPESKLPSGLAPFDGAFACCVFHHIPPSQHLSVLKDLKHVLKTGGLLMVYEHNPFNPLTVRAVRTCPFDENAILLSAQQLARVAEEAGFREIRVDYRVFFPGSLAWLRPLENRLRWLPLGAQYFVAMRA